MTPGIQLPSSLPSPAPLRPAARHLRVLALVAALATAPSPAASAQETRGGPETETRTFTVGASGSLDIFNLAGPIVVTGVGGDTITVKAVKHVRGRGGAEVQDQLDAVEIETTETGGRVEVRTVVRRRTKPLSTWVDYTVQVPLGTAVTARSLAGDVKVSKVRGEVRMESSSGSLEATGTPNLLLVKTLSGDVLITDAGAGDTLTASTVSGRLVVSGVKARVLECTSISGDVLLADTISERASARTVSGAVEFSGPLAKSGRYEFNSHAGDIRLKLSGRSGFELTARTFSGQVQSDLALEVSPKDPGVPPGVPQKRDVRGVFGDGSALLLVKTFSGSVTVTRAEGAGTKPGRK